MINKLRGLVLVGCLALAPAAFAIPFSITISSVGGYTSGNWSLSGATNTGGSFAFPIAGSTTANRDINAGLHTWGIGGTGYFAGVSWILRVNGNVVGAGADAGGWAFRIDDRGQFTAVPEPGTLALLGLGLLGIGFSVRRRQPEA